MLVRVLRVAVCVYPVMPGRQRVTALQTGAEYWMTPSSVKVGINQQFVLLR